MSTLQEQLFGEQSFVQFTLDEAFIKRRSGLNIDNNVVVELWDNGVLYFQPQGGTLKNSILLSVGVHGNETAPIEIIDQLVTDILAGKVSVKQTLLIVIANPKAIKVGSREIDENMNRLFNGALTGKDEDSDERRRSRTLMDYSRDFFSMDAHKKIHYDLHTAIRGSVYKQFAVSPNRWRPSRDWASVFIIGTMGHRSHINHDAKERYILCIHCQYFGSHQFYPGAWQCKTLW